MKGKFRCCTNTFIGHLFSELSRGSMLK